MRPILIAEACQNHNGDRGLLREMIRAAAENGADYVKIQAVRSRELTHRRRFDAGVTDADGTVRVIRRPYSAELERLVTLDLTPDDEAWFAEECLRAGVDSMITAFTRRAAREVGEMGYSAIKIASYDCASYPLLRDVRRRASTIFVSTGATHDAEVERAAEVLAGVRFAFLHCVTIYPTPIEACHLRRMQWLRRFTPRVGWSDHTRVATDGIRASKIALALGADVIERHFTLLEESETKDGPVSIGPDLLAELRRFADLPRRQRMTALAAEDPEWERALGQARRPLSHAELLNRDYYRGRFASRVGDRFVYNWEDVDLASPGQA